MVLKLNPSPMAKSAIAVVLSPKSLMGVKITSLRWKNLQKNAKSRAKKGGKVKIFLIFSLKLTWFLLAKESIKVPNKEIGRVVAKIS